jgi:hypothetical protein
MSFSIASSWCLFDLAAAGQGGRIRDNRHCGESTGWRTAGLRRIWKQCRSQNAPRAWVGRLAVNKGYAALMPRAIRRPSLKSVGALDHITRGKVANMTTAALLSFIAFFQFAPAPSLDAVQIAGEGAEIGQAGAPDGQEFCGPIGVRVSPMTKPIATSLGMNQPYGAIFGQPRPGSPAEHADIEAGDVLTEINGTPLKSWRDFRTVMAGFSPGTSVYFRTYRDGQQIDRTVMLGYAKCGPRSKKTT